MININKFKLNRKLNVNQQNFILTNYIEDFIKYKNLDFLLIKISNIFSIPKNNFYQDIRIFLCNNFKNSEGVFFKKFSFLNSIFSFIKSIAFLFWILIFSKKKKKNQIKFDILVDNIDHEAEAFRFLSFVKLFKNYSIISSRKLNINCNYYLFEKYKNISLKIVSKFFLQLLSLYCITFYLSFKDRTNYFEIILLISKKIIKYEDIFTNIISDHLIQERQFTTSSIKNYIFKKYGGLKTALFQRNIAQINGPGMYTFSDYFFSIGKKTHQQYIKCSSKFEKIYPVGSFFLNSVEYNKKQSSEIPKFDLLHIASNMNYFQNTHEGFMNDWYEQFNWIKILSNKFPNLKIAIKGREGDGLKENIKFTKMLDNSNINFIDSHKMPNKISDNKFHFEHSSLHSYAFALNAKVNCTWQSTMGFELLSFDKRCIFLDPGGRNIAHLPNDAYHNELKVTNYEKFEELFFKIYNGENTLKNVKIDDYCLNSINTHKKIFEILKNS